MVEDALGRGARSVLLAVGTVSALACGLRTDPLFMGDPTVGDSDSVTAGTGDIVVDPDRVGSCNMPLEIPFENTTISGTLPDGHGSLYAGWCGRDGGVEDAYRFVPYYDADVTFAFRPEGTDFTPTLRVQVDPCGDSAGPINVCTSSVLERPYHFLARNGTIYWVTIDTASPGQGGDYAFDVQIGDPGLQACPIHPERIAQSPGAAFVWGNEFSEGQGQVDGYCGAPGKENMFQVDAGYPGAIYVRAEGVSGEFVPVLSVRTGCGAVTELVCSSSGDTGIPGVAELYGYIPGPGTYYLVVDQQAADKVGEYSLRVDFE